MNKLNLLLALCLTVYSCNNNPGDEKPPQTGQPTGRQAQQDQPCNYEVNSVDAQKMINAFAVKFKDARLKKDFWLEACAVKSLNTFLQAPGNNFDGVRFFSGFDNSDNKNISTLFMVVTSPVQSPSNEYKHTNRWEIEIPDMCPTTEVFVNKKEAVAKKQLKPFGKILREQMDEDDRASAVKDSLSSGVWVDKCVIKKLAALIDSNGNLDGIKIIAAAYCKEVQARTGLGTVNLDKQSTFILLPTDKPSHEINWKLIDTRKRPVDGYNHSQLCPQICD